MILTPAEYHCIAPANPFTQPPNPGVLVPNPVGTAAQIVIAEDMHCITKKLYLETLLLKQTIIQKTIKALDTKYLATLSNLVTRQITPLVLTILDFLYNNYRRITLQKLDDKTTIVKSMTYNLSHTIDLIFKSINDLVKYTRSYEG